MTLPEFSVLLLAWDDADPTVAVLGGAALPPTLPLVYQLAARHPVLAVYPHLPKAKDEVAISPPTVPEPPSATQSATSETVAPRDFAPEAASEAAPEAATAALATAVDQPGVQLLPAPVAEKKAAGPVLQSRIIGVADLVPAATSEPAATAAISGASAAAVVSPTPVVAPLLPPLPPPGRSQWPTGVNAPALTGWWQAPAAPYLGAGADGLFLPPPASLRPLATAASTETAQPAAAPIFGPVRGAALSTTTVAMPRGGPQPPPPPPPDDLDFAPAPEQPAGQHPAVFEETTEEIGAGEAADLSAPEDDLVPDAPAAAATGAGTSAPTPELPAPAVPTLPTSQPESLNFRMIQYARQAMQLVQGRSADFGVIYAPSWPTWLAALEICNHSRRPLVLYVASLALDLPNPAEHGYQLALERMAMRRARLVLVPDAALRHRLLALYEEAASKVRVVAADNDAAVQRALGEVAMG